MTNKSYRADIDGLRAIAVLIVVFYHAHLRGFSGGFIGVDIFFVISGFLISTLILQEFLKGGFSPLIFFSRRIRRILPALTAVTLFTAVAGFLLLPPNDFSSLAKATKSLAFFISNHIFLRSQNDYWEQNTLGSQPLLHTWSIAIEEQFYIIFPLLLSLFFLWKKKTKRSLKTLSLLFTLLALVSFGVSAYLIKLNPPSAFYLLPARGWELLLGCLISIWVILRPEETPKKYLELLSALGFLIILWCTLTFDHQTSFPSWNAVFPCLGAGLIVFAGSIDRELFINKFLSVRPLVFIGLISYSLYLWHWPLFVFAKSPYWIYWDIGMPSIFSQIIIAFVLAYLSWKFVETPFRAKKDSHPVGALIAGLILLLSIFGFGLFEDSIVRGTAPITQHFPLALKDLISPKDEIPFRVWQFSDDPEQILREGGKLIGDKTEEPSFIVLGDSFASMWGQTLDSRARVAKKSGLMMAREWCASLEGLARKTEPSCFRINEARMKYTEESKIKNVALAMDWPEIYPSDTGPEYFLKDNPREKNLRLVALERTLTRLGAAGKEVFVVLPIVGSGGSPFNYAISSLKSKDKVAYGITREKYLSDDRIQKMLAEFDQLQNKYHFTILDPMNLLCDEKGCLTAKDGKPIYHDEYHLSYFGSEMLVKIFDPLLY